MKIAIPLILLAAGLTAFAQPPGPPGREVPEDARSGPRPFGNEGGPFRGNRPGFMTETWMDKIRDSDPAEFDRLQALRAEDPDAFRAELRMRFRAELSRRLERERPAVLEAFRKLSPEDQEWVLSRLQPRPMGPPEEAGAEPRGEGRRGFQPDDESSIPPLVSSYRKAADPAEKERIRGQLREKLAESFDRRTARRSEDLARFESRIAEMKNVLNERKAHRDEIIARRLQELTEREHFEW